MKISPKQVAIAILCIIIAFVPTYIAITYYFSRDGVGESSSYTVSVLDQDGGEVSSGNLKQKDIAKIVLTMNKKMYSASSSVEADKLPEKYFDITLTSNGSSSTYRYYFSMSEGEKTVVYSLDDQKYFYVNYEDSIAFLSTPCAQGFYSTSKAPTLSISGGDDVLPVDAEWKFKAISGDMVGVAGIEMIESAPIHSMNSSTKLSFDIAPDVCKIKISKDGKVIDEVDSLSDIPYEMLDDSAISFEIFAQWTSSDEYSGYANYRFTSTVGLAPEFFINKTSIQSGEFVLVYAKNVTAPQKIEFSSSPSINFTPVFFEENGIVYALIPIDKNLEMPMQYTFSFTYGEVRSEVRVNVSERDIKDRNYDVSTINVSRNENTLNEYAKLLNQIGLEYESTRYFSDKFTDYSLEYTTDTATIILGFGHRRTPSNGDTPYRLDGVDYYIAPGTNVTAIASGKVVYVGESALLGKFIVIDHGLGLKTWYCNLGEVLATEGTVLAKGDVIGTPGTSGYKNTSGVYLITTVMNVPVSPYSLQEDGLTLPR